MYPMNKIVAAAALTFVIVSALTAHAEEGFRDLFNGKDLTGWVKVNVAPSTFTVKDGMLICTGKPIGEMRTDRMYQNFIMEVEWRHMKPKGNAGIFLWADDITAKGQPFHRGIEVQVLENAYGNGGGHTVHGDIFPIHGARMKPINGRGGGRAFPTEHRSKPSPQWNHYRITCNDGNISLAVNGKVVTQGTQCNPRKGYICIESEGGVVHYRNIRIKELPNTPVTPEQTAIANRGYRTLYTGVDLAGLKHVPDDKGKPHWHARDWLLQFDGQSTADDRSIATTESFGDFGFVVDAKLNDESGAATLQLRGSDNASINLLPKHPKTGKPMASLNKWTRFEGTLRGNKLSVTVNGKVLYENHVLEGIPANGPIKIVPTGPLTLANLFVRDLK